MKNVQKYYDDFSEEQKKTGINKRHFAIQKWLNKFGIFSNSIILEIGCGIGTQTELIAKEVDSGQITAIDISKKSIDIAKQRLNKYKNIEFIAADIITCELKIKFDIIVLPDVIEHIPIEQHNILFEKLSSLLKPSGYIFIHIPNPYYLEWCHKNTPEILQIIDQPIYTNTLSQNIYQHNLYIHYLNTYSIWIDNCDYQAIVLKPVLNKEYQELIPPIPSLQKRLMNKIKTIFK